MRIEQGHAAAGRNPVELLFPSALVLPFQHDEERGILNQRVGQFHIATAFARATQNGQTVFALSG
jgi:hypothetical protein